MVFRKFHITGYRAIRDTKIEFSKNQLIPIIGINESGKTSILQAILAFDKSKDKANGGRHLEYKDKYQIGMQDCVIRAHIQLRDEDEVAEIISALALRSDTREYLDRKLTSAIAGQGCLVIGRNLREKRYFLEDFDLDSAVERQLLKHILGHLPFILYFDDFSDRVPEEIVFPKDYDGHSIKGTSIKAEWQRLVEEVVKRSSDEYSLIDLLQMPDEDDQQALLDDITDVLNDEIISEWKQLKDKGRLFADDELDLELKLELTSWNDGSHTFKFKVVDKSKEGRKRQFNVVERSKGFQWFFNFMLKLKFNAKYKSNPSDAIYLLDEPGSYLHSSAQDELLKELKDISATNIILYCTHSQHLLDPEIINVSTIRIASKQAGTIKIYPFGSYPRQKNAGALAPLYDALRLKTPFPSAVSARVVVMEGITDYYFFRMAQRYLSLKVFARCILVPGAGAGNLRDLISLVIASTEDFLVAFDQDDAGRKAARRYTNFFDEEIAGRFVFYGPLDQPGDFRLEDHLEAEDVSALLSLTGAKDVKSAIVALYYAPAPSAEVFFKSLGADSVKRIRETVDQLSHCSHSPAEALEA
ncbi:MAG TPA: AAA family ATPase [Gammaproteobacteria bacterium]|nr:AAA family ATPase [Gammaproteobacteria bacterium]